MFVVIQIPLFDTAYASGDPEVGGVDLAFPPKRTRPDPVPFLRSAGAAMARRGDPPPGVEASSYDAHRALRLEPGALRFERRSREALIADCRFRRLIGDGTWDYRLEIGFGVRPGVEGIAEPSEEGDDERIREPHRQRRIRPRLDGDRTWEPTDIFDAVRELMRLPTVVAPPQGSKWDDRKTGSLHEMAEPLAELLASSLSTTSPAASARRMRAGRPLVYIEARIDDSQEPLESFHAVDLGQAPDTLPLLRQGTVYLGRQGRGGEVDVFLADASAGRGTLRNLRLCLMRMRSALWCLEQFLEGLTSGELVYRPQTEHGQQLEGYLERVVSFLERGRFYGFRTGELQQAFVALWQDHRGAVEGKLGRWADGLGSALAGARPNTSNKLTRWFETVRRLFGKSVFLSYDWDDQHAAKALQAALEANGVTVWRDEHHMLPGRRLGHDLRRAIHAQDFLIACCTPRSLESEWVQEELRFGLERERWLQLHQNLQSQIVIPVLLEGTWEPWEEHLPDRVAENAIGWEGDAEVLNSAAEGLARAVRGAGETETLI